MTTHATGERKVGLFATHDPATMAGDAEAHGGLKKSMGAVGLTAMGVGAIIGTGIFVVIGEGVRTAGPAVIFSFMLAAVTCAFSALSYAELSAAVPVSGSAYTFAYATLGEIVAFVIGWDLILEYGVSCAAVAAGWGANLNALLESAFGVAIPERWSTATFAEGAPSGSFNIPAVFIVLVIMGLLMLGTRESATANLVMVVLKLGILLFFIGAAFTAFNAEHFTPFQPHGSASVLTAAGAIFFAYIGFDAVSTGSEEAKNPSRDLPLAIIGSLAISTVFYILVSVGAIGVAPASLLGASEAPLADGLNKGAGMPWAGAILALGAIIAITSVLLVIMYGQTRIFFAMCRDGLVFQSMAKVHPRFGTPVRLTLAFGIFIAIVAAIAPLHEIVKLVNIGTLFAFVIVNVGVIILRRTRPDMKRPFRVPFSPVFPIIGILFCLYPITGLPWETWVRFGDWLALGMAIYFLYSYKPSRLRRGDVTTQVDQ